MNKNFFYEYRLQEKVICIFFIVTRCAFYERKNVMEKILSIEERIRRAEQVYSKRRENNKTYADRYNFRDGRIYEENVKIRIIKKVLMQIFACICIYLVIYILQNTNELFSKEVNNKINEILSYDMNVDNIGITLNSFWNKINEFATKTEIEEKEENNTLENSIQENEVVEEKIEENITAVEEVAPVDSVSIVEEVKEPKSQEELDVEYIKNNFNIIWPLNGVITSKFGTRTPTEIVTANHYGLDIGGNMGADIIAAMDGTVTLVSQEGDYGKHIKIENNDVTTLYAHCSTLCVQEGAAIKQGEKIAEVGSTGRSTGPHLHFEVRIGDRAIDPELIL